MKAIKKLGKILAYSLAVLVVLLVTLYFTLQSYAVQTWLGNEAALRITGKLKTKVVIRTVRFDFFNKVELGGVYIEDRQKDTLLYIEVLNVTLEELERKRQNMLLGDVTMRGAKVYLVKQQNDSIWNYKYILRALSGADSTRSSDSSYWNIGVRKLKLEDARFAYRNEHDTSKSRAMNYSDLLVTGINTQISDIVAEADTIRASVDRMKAQEQCGFVLQDLSCFVNLCPVQTKLDVLKIKTEQSFVETDLVFTHAEYDDYNYFEERMRMKAAFTKSRVYSGDIAYFAPDLKGIDRMVMVSGKVSGKVNDLKGRDMEISLGKYTFFKGDFDMNGLPDVDNTYMHFTIKKLSTTREELVQLPSYPFYKKENLEIPGNIALLGRMELKGDFSGFISDFHMYGSLQTALGKVATDISFREDTVSGLTHYSGRVRTENFNIGKYLYVEQLGAISADIMVEGKGLNKHTLVATLKKGDVYSLEFNGYNYQNIKVEGEIARRIFKGKLEIKDENLDMDFNGNVDFSKDITNLDFISSINSADIAALKLVKSPHSTNLSSLVSIRIEGNSIDNLTGRINFDNTFYRDGENKYRFSTFDLVSEIQGSRKFISLYSDFAHAWLKGEFNLEELPRSFLELMNHYFPSYVNLEGQKKKNSAQTFEYMLEFRKSNDFTRLFFPDMKISPGTLVKGSFASETNGFSLFLESNNLQLSGTDFRKCSVNLKGIHEKIEIESSVKRILFINDTLGLSNVVLNASGGNDTLNTTIGWDNRTARKTQGNLALGIVFGQKKSIRAEFLPTQFYLNDSLWSLGAGNSVLVDSSGITIRNFSLNSGRQQIFVQGKVSEQKNEQLLVDIRNLDLATLNPFLISQGIELQGMADSKSQVSDIFNNVIFTSGSEFTNLSVNGETIGSGSLESVFDKKKNALYLHGSFTKGVVPNILFSGYYYPTAKDESLDLELNLQALKLQLLEPYVKEYCADLKGQFSGSLAIKGTPDKPRVTGKLNVQAKKVTVNYLNTSYSFNNDDITISENSISVNNLLLTDQYLNTALVSGKVTHRNYKNFQLSFSLESKNFLLLNTTEAHNSLYYGRAFVSGTAELFGFLDNVTIEANLKTEKISEDKKVEYTKIYIPLSSTEEVEETGFITFIKKDTGTTAGSYKVNLDGIQLNMDLEVTPDAQVQLIFDEKIGDIIKGRGTGNIKMRINTLGNFYMYGDYRIEDGDYLFTLKNVINKKFRIEKGGVIKWSGDPYSADINLVTIYQARSSLKPFFPYDSAAVYKKRYPVNCILKLTGDLMAPTIAFDIDLPTVDETTKQHVKNYLTSEQEMNQQVFSLLVMNSFVTPAQLRSLGVAETSRGNAGTANSSELLSNQLSNWLSQISNDFDIGVNYRPGDDISDEQLEVALSTQLFNDRVSIDGNVGVSGSNEQNTNNIVGDVTVDYKLSDDGKFRVKAFNKTNDHIVATGKGPYTQGVGVFYREEFETFEELYRRYLEKLKRKPKNEETVNPD